jgi:hypothetical protein
MGSNTMTVFDGRAVAGIAADTATAMLRVQTASAVVPAIRVRLFLNLIFRCAPLAQVTGWRHDRCGAGMWRVVGRRDISVIIA